MEKLLVSDKDLTDLGVTAEEVSECLETDAAVQFAVVISGRNIYADLGNHREIEIEPVGTPHPDLSKQYFEPQVNPNHALNTKYKLIQKTGKPSATRIAGIRQALKDYLEPKYAVTLSEPQEENTSVLEGGEIG